MIINFPCRLCSDEVGDNNDSVQCDLCSRWNHIGCLNIGTSKNKENLKKIHYPGIAQTVMEIPFSTLSYKGVKTVLFGRSSLTFN